jgi:hypothetical protein
LHQAAIDLDQRLIETLLSEGTDQAKSEAFDVYKSGANSKSYAEITLTNGLPVAVPKGVMFQGKTSSGSEVIGTTMTDSSAGETVLQIQYYVSSMQETYVMCRVSFSSHLCAGKR